MTIAGLVIASVGFASAQGKDSIVQALKNAEASSNTALNPGHSKHDKDKDGRDEHMDDKKGNGYGHKGKPKDNCPPVPEPASMLALGIGSGVVFLRKKFQKKSA